MGLEELIKTKLPIEAGPRVAGERIFSGRIKGSIKIHLDVEHTGDDEADVENMRQQAARHLKYGLKELGETI